MSSPAKQRAQIKHSRKRRARWEARKGKRWSEMSDGERLSTKDKLRAFFNLKAAADALAAVRIKKEV